MLSVELIRGESVMKNNNQELNQRFVNWLKITNQDFKNYKLTDYMSFISRNAEKYKKINKLDVIENHKDFDEFLSSTDII